MPGKAIAIATTMTRRPRPGAVFVRIRTRGQRRITTRIKASSSLPSDEQSPQPATILDAFLANPVAFLAGAFVGVMELDVSSEDSEIARVLRTDLGRRR